MYLVCGEALFDVFSLESAARSNELGFTAIAGGSPFNVAVGLRRLGVEAALFGGLSSDYLGTRLRRVLDESTRTQPQARQQAAYEQAYRRYLEHLPPR